MSNASTNFNSLDKMLQADIAYASENGKVLNTEYSAELVHEYSIIPTSFHPSTEDTNMPFDTPSEDVSDPFA